MMRKEMKRTGMIFGATLLLGIAASAAPILMLDPADGAIRGASGQRVGWGFQVKPDAILWTSFVASFVLIENGPMTGSYDDNIGLQGGPVNFVLAPGSSDWIQVFSEANGTGLGFYTVDPSAIIGDTNSGTLGIAYELYTDDPNSCGDCFATSGQFEVAYSVTAVPEPGTAVILLLGLGTLALGRWRRAGQI